MDAYRREWIEKQVARLIEQDDQWEMMQELTADVCRGSRTAEQAQEIYARVMSAWGWQRSPTGEWV